MTSSVTQIKCASHERQAPQVQVDHQTQEMNPKENHPQKQNKLKMPTMADPDAAKEPKTNALDSPLEDNDLTEVLPDDSCFIHPINDRLHSKEKDVLNPLLALNEEKLSSLQEIQQAHKNDDDASPANKGRACNLTKEQKRSVRTMQKRVTRTGQQLSSRNQLQKEEVHTENLSDCNTHLRNSQSLTFWVQQSQSKETQDGRPCGRTL